MVQKLAKGDERAFKFLYNKYYNDVYRFSLSLLKSSANAEEILQDVFLQCWLNRGYLDHKKSFKSYLFTCVRNAAFNALKKKAYENKLKSSLELKIESSANTTENNLITEDYNRLRIKAIDSLPPKRKLIFEMSRKEGMSYEDISRELNLSISTVKNQMSKALENIRTYLHMNSDLPIGVLLLVLFQI
ncbi:RNA polymerase sigma factor [Leeuwenhoekiella palythoae]|nr:RNA polymerase sigma-70 factor [Leeuwenhoekiella palythoae]RXG31467.1 RNA polymerase sigma-70 factor (ECF subfamily) [Leeuwenhoekiella palythoae]